MKATASLTFFAIAAALGNISSSFFIQVAIGIHPIIMVALIAAVFAIGALYCGIMSANEWIVEKKNGKRKLCGPLGTAVVMVLALGDALAPVYCAISENCSYMSAGYWGLMVPALVVVALSALMIMRYPL